MIFKNAHVYRLTQPLTLDSSECEAAFAAKAFAPCSGIRPSSFGWIPPIPENSLVHEVAGCLLICAKREDKVVPSSALADTLEEKITRLESLEARPIRAKEKQRLKEDALAELLPRALPKSKQIMGYLSKSEDLLVIDTTSSSEAEMFLNCLRETLGSLKVVPPQVKAKPGDTFTHWLRSRKLPDNFSLGDQCDLFDPEDGSAVSLRRQDLATSEARVHLDAGKTCSKLSLIWHGDLKVIVDKDLVLRQIKVLSSDDSAEDDEDPVAQIDAAFVNMTLELSRFLPALYSALGGESRE
ncbi:MAG: recombination-associated protein RdgC [Gammaproteobacteria bacterium]|jgi:recombination associated protein RdgC|nr:recombination-associated protein RdgC [Gammaproteobacteria bacterium]MBT4493512.1 recombination-associated protein RdgC [Gammaproteobacteria bacterium]MBT7369532.1 recombination-associated protein RdgC [Gammaproteobacteria bacterium]